MTQTPTLTGQDIGRAHHATRAVLERRLAATGTPFEAWIVLNIVGDNGPEIEVDDVVRRVVLGLKITETAVQQILSGLLGQGLISRTTSGPSPRVALTEVGTARFDDIRGSIAQITERLYGGLPAEDLAVAHRLLVTVTERANAELAG
jgi:DNA-binding MarR family transcriptional regulator